MPENMELKDKIRTHDSARFFTLEALKGLLELVRDTRPDVVLGITKKELEEGTSVDLREWNQEWVSNAKKIIENLWKSGNLLSLDVVKVIEGVLHEKGESSGESQGTPQGV